MQYNGALKRTALVVTILTGIAVLANTVDNRYAKASDVQALTSMVYDFRLSERRRELWALLIEQDKRPLTEREKQRKLELEAEIKDLEEKKKQAEK